MGKVKVKRFLLLTLSVIMVIALLAGCAQPAPAAPAEPASGTGEAAESPKAPEDFTGEITFWHFNKDEAPNLIKAFNERYPNIKVNLQITSDTDLGYQNKVTAAIRARSGMPDVFVAENAFVKRFVNLPGGFADLSAAPYNAESMLSKMVPYTVDIGRSSDGKIRALSWQACPGGVGYKRDLAKKYLGTDDPKAIADMLTTPEKILDTARKLKEASGGKAKLFVGTEDLYKIYAGSRNQAWVENNKLVIDPKMLELVDLSKQLRDEDLEGGIRQWTPAWSAAVSDDIHMCYAIPTWGIQWIVAVNDQNNQDTGRWGIATPIPYYEGGTWIGISEQSKNKELAWEMVKFLSTDAGHLRAWAKQTGDFVSNTDIIEELTNDASFVNKTVNQNTYEVYGPMVDKINGNLITQYDDTARKNFQDVLQTYLEGAINKDEFVKQFKDIMRANLQDVTVE